MVRENMIESTIYYLKELVGTKKDGSPKTKIFYKNRNYEKVKQEFDRLCSECNHTRSYYISMDKNI